MRRNALHPTLILILLFVSTSTSLPIIRSIIQTSGGRVAAAGNFTASPGVNRTASSLTITAIQGNGQTAAINSAFVLQLQAKVEDAGTPQADVAVSFTGPSTGAGGTFTGGASTVTVATDSSGLATASVFNANGTTGSYFVNANISGGPSADFALTNSKATQTISFDPISDKVFDAPAFSLNASASSGLAVSFELIAGMVTLNNNSVTINGTGEVVIRASQSGNDSFEAAASVDRSFNIAPANQQITFAPPTDRTFGDPDFGVVANASSGLDVSFRARGDCGINGQTVHLQATGSCVITASQTGNENFNAAPELSRPFFVFRADGKNFVLTSFGAAGDGSANDAPALQAALNAAAAAGGGTIFISSGHYALATPVSKIFHGEIVSIQGLASDRVFAPDDAEAAGLDLASDLLPKTGDQTAINISGLYSLTVRDISFTGTPDELTDAFTT